MALGILFAAFLWGFAEASFFFVVPDLYLSFLATAKDRRLGLKGALAALLGALAGGAVIYLWASASPALAAAFIEAVPAISPEMLQEVTRDLSERGLSSLFLGAMTGVPYKVYALQAAGLSLPLESFLLVTLPARLFRWLPVIFLTRYICAAIAGRWSLGAARAALGCFWLLFYAAFFTTMPG